MPDDDAYLARKQYEIDRERVADLLPSPGWIRYVPKPPEPIRPAWLDVSERAVNDFAKGVPSLPRAIAEGVGLLLGSIVEMRSSGAIPKGTTAEAGKRLQAGKETVTEKMGVEIGKYAPAAIGGGMLADGAGMLVRVGVASTADFLTGAVVENPDEQNAAALIVELAKDNPDSAVLQALKAPAAGLQPKEGDSEAAKRAKRGVVESVLSPMGELAVPFSRWVKGAGKDKIEALETFAAGWREKRHELANAFPEMTDDLYGPRFGEVAPDLAAQAGAETLAKAARRAEGAK